MAKTTTNKTLVTRANPTPTPTVPSTTTTTTKNGGGGGGGTISADKTPTPSTRDDSKTPSTTSTSKTLNETGIVGALAKAAREGTSTTTTTPKSTTTTSSTTTNKSGSSSSKSSSSSSKSNSSSSSSKSSSSSSSSSTNNSEYYNTRGDTAKEYQEYLNSLGADLDVDGIWGKKTEAAYQTNKDAFNEWLSSKNSSSTSTSTSSGTSSGTTSTTTAGINSSDLANLLANYKTDAYTAKSDDELMQDAENQYAAQYNADVLAAKQKNEQYQLSITQQIENLKKTLEENKETTNKQYENNGNYLQRLLTARGMGRSTYAGDVAQNNLNNQASAIAKLLEDYNTSSSQLSAQSALYSQQTADTLAQLLSDKQTNVTNAYNTLKENEYTKQKEAQDSYNTIVQALQSMLESRSESQTELAESIRQFNEQLAENKRQFNATLANS